MGKQVMLSTKNEISTYKRFFSSCDWWKQNGKTNFYGIINSIKASKPKGRDPENLYKLRLLVAKGLGVKTIHVRVIPTINTPLQNEGLVAYVEISKPRRKRVTIAAKHLIKNGNKFDVSLNHEDLGKKIIAEKIVFCLKKKMFGKRKAKGYRNQHNRIITCAF